MIFLPIVSCIGLFSLCITINDFELFVVQHLPWFQRQFIEGVRSEARERKNRLW